MKGFLLVNKLIVFTLCYYWSQIPGVLCLRNVVISMPDAVERGNKVRLLCRYNLEGEMLYTLKWYRGEHEFYRFTPKETPPIKIFEVRGYPDLDIVREESNGEQVTIRRALPSISGRYSCEVTTDSPSFHALSTQAELRVVVLPNQKLPQIIGSKPRMKPGEKANLTCISSGSIPAANLTWSLNDEAVTGKHEIFNSQRVINANDQEESVSNLILRVETAHFNETTNKLKIRCTASIYSIYQQSNEITIEQDRPHKWLHTPQVQRHPTYITDLPNVKLSRANVHVDNGFNENSANNMIEAENLEHPKGNAETITASIYVAALAIIMRQLC